MIWVELFKAFLSFEQKEILELAQMKAEKADVNISQLRTVA